MKSMIFPNNMSLYYSEEDNKEKDKEKLKEKEKGYNDNIEDNFSVYEYNDNFNNELLKNYCVIFSSNPQTENNSKKSINGFAYIFYKKLIRKQITSKKIYSFYIPVVFSIVSEYPFFNSFYKLCRQIKTLFNIPKNYTPIEIMLYNIIKYTESPINCDVNLSIKPFLWQIDRNIFEVVKAISINEENNEDEVEHLRKSDESESSADKGNIKAFGLKGLYAMHDDYVKEIIEKAAAYDKTARQMIADTFQKRGYSPDQVFDFVWGKYLDDAQYENRVLSKLTKDLLEQLKIRK